MWTEIITYVILIVLTMFYINFCYSIISIKLTVVEIVLAVRRQVIPTQGFLNFPQFPQANGSIAS
jgi:hypothetical protein